MTQNKAAVLTTTAFRPFLLSPVAPAPPTPVFVAGLQMQAKLTAVVTPQFTLATQVTATTLQAKLTMAATGSVTMPPDSPASTAQVTAMTF